MILKLRTPSTSLGLLLAAVLVGACATRVAGSQASDAQVQGLRSAQGAPRESTSSSAPSAPDSFDARAFCASGPSASRFVSEVFPDASRRQAVAELLAPRASRAPDSQAAPEGSGCNQVLAAALNGLAEGDPSALVKENRVGFFLLGAEAKHPGLQRALTAAMALEQGDNTAWLAALLEADRDAGREALRQWFVLTAKGLRETQKLSRLSPDLYGKAASAPDSEGLTDVKLTSPLLFGRYLEELSRGGFASDAGGAAEQMSSLTIVWALQDPGSRRLHLETFARLVAGREGAFLAAFRREHPLVQFRLLPVLASAGTPTSVRELIWVSSHHADIRCKSLASALLDAPPSRAN